MKATMQTMVRTVGPIQMANQSVFSTSAPAAPADCRDVREGVADRARDDAPQDRAEAVDHEDEQVFCGAEALMSPLEAALSTNIWAGTKK